MYARKPRVLQSLIAIKKGNQSDLNPNGNGTIIDSGVIGAAWGRSRVSRKLAIKRENGNGNGNIYGQRPGAMVKT
jgi:hypothetical protein